MKIRKLTPEYHPKVYALLRQAFPETFDEEQLVVQLHRNRRMMYEWICILSHRVIAYIAFTNAYKGSEICGLHLAPLAVKPDFQNQGIGSELLRFALRQDVIRSRTLFVLGDPGFYGRFGFVRCSRPVCPFDENNAHFLSIRNKISDKFIVGYEPEFNVAEYMESIVRNR